MPLECDKLLHPFQNDPGTSQKQRVMDALLGGPAQIDGRSMADLLQYFVSIAPNIVYYDKDMNPGFWTPFFQKSLPFLLAGMTNFTTDGINSKLDLYGFLFRRRPSGAGLQLNLFYIYYNLIRRLNDWSLQLKDSQLPIEATIDKLIVNKLKQPLLQFIGIVNAAVKWYGVRKVDFGPLVNNPIWGIDATDLYALDTAFKKAGPSERKRLLALQKEALGIVPAFTAAFGVLSGAASGNIQQSLVPLAADLQQQHQPHLALIFVFLQLFLQLQKDINGFRKEHLDFFYTNVLQLKPQPAVSDHANLIIYLQNQVKSYALAKGILVKDGKDNNKADILFALDDAIAVNLTQVKSICTLFCNNRTTYDQTWTEGVYMAPDATMADGVSIAFTGDPTNYPTLGAKYSKYVPPGGTELQPYPGARIGFLLASNVLLLNEGTRKVTITLSCALRDKPCGTAEDYPDWVSSTLLYPALQKVLTDSFVEVTEALIQQAQQQGVSEAHCDAIRDKWLEDTCHKSLCGLGTVYYLDSALPRWSDWTAWLGGAGLGAGAERDALNLLFVQIYPFTISFSGAKQWIVPAPPAPMTPVKITAPAMLGGGGSFQITIVATLGPDQDAVTFYSAKVLGEDVGITQPVVKVELNDKIKIPLNAGLQVALGLTAGGAHCCLDVPPDFCNAAISMYQFFRDVAVTDTQIDVNVCGLKNFIVQNDAALQNVNSPIFPFGTRPKVVPDSKFNSNFYIGSEEIFLKHWNNIYINLNWKDFPTSTVPMGFTGPFNFYYNGYQETFANGKKTGVIDDSQFQMSLSILQDGEWKDWTRTPLCFGGVGATSDLFQAMPAAPTCPDDSNYRWQYQVARATDFPALGDPTEKFGFQGLKQLSAGTRQSFIRITLQCQDFQHDKYPYVLARQMSALGRLPDFLDGAVYFGITGAGQYVVLDINQLLSDVLYAAQLANDGPPTNLNTPALKALVTKIKTELTTGAAGTRAARALHVFNTHPIKSPGNVPAGGFPGVDPALQKIFSILATYEAGIAGTSVSRGVVIPNQPWTPTISNMSLDYDATAKIDQLSLIHLYPFTGTYEPMQITLQPPLFPLACDEGTLFVGLEGLVPGSNVNFLFQLAEATANSESDPATVYYSYLAGNKWRPLRPGFEVLKDGTEGLTRTGILKLALPANMTKTNTVMPNGLFWIKAAVAEDVEGVSETFAIVTQAVGATFVNSEANEQARMSSPLAAGALSRLSTADSNIKSIGQPYPSFGGAPPEEDGNFYLRVSELLHHKGRAIQKFDYERLVLQQYPVIYKAKCINHSFARDGDLYKNDFPIAPGYVLLAVIPDLNKLAAGNSLQPKVPVSILEDIYTYISGLTSPFVRFRAMNPRYEKINFCIKVRLLEGMDLNFFRQQLVTDLTQFLAPWAVGQYDKLTFGQPVYRSDVVGFIESLYYIDYIMELEMFGEFEKVAPATPHLAIYGRTPRSILIGGDIEVNTVAPECEKWGQPSCKPYAVPVRTCDPKQIKKEEMV
jgi:hypothetical protein